MRKRCDRPDDSTSHHNSHLTDRREHSHAGGAFFKCLNLCWSLRLPPVSIYSSSQTEESWRDLFCVLRSFFPESSSPFRESRTEHAVVGVFVCKMRVAPSMPLTTPLVHRVSLTMKALSAKDLPGVTAPLDYFDPLGFCNGVDEGRIRFYREVELKHGRVAMLAALGFVVGENFHPLFGGNIDVPSYIAFQQTPLQEFWRYVMFAIGLLELVSVSSFEFPVAIEWSDGQRRVFPRLWQVRASHKLGDFGFDPMGLKPTTEAELKAMQSKELNNGRAAMIGIAGMVAQELASGAKLLG